ncbi:Eco57I restriction-modification methylase domain-containing protein, partial [Burkholderia cepacia]|uniref:Eco57I restriction-modification methylase domain-containing protein n=1 Tax=Burkholderia cepacia TaxID=292 RepID=UPI0012D981FB
MNFIENETKQKLRGGYYTPLDLAIFISKWVKEVKPKNILEPSCGDGVFFEALAKAKGFQTANVVGFELDSVEAQKSRARASDVGLKSIQVNSEDFLGWAIDHLHDGGARFDAVIGNPPFVRYQYLPEPFQICAEQIFDKLALRFTKHTNAWVSFILAGMALLRPGGRFAMVVPAAIIHVTHAQSLRSY